MVNLEHKLTVDDLIVEFMMCKVKNGYEPSFLASEFMIFLHFFEKQMSVEDTLYDTEKLFKRFFERKADSDWSTTTNLIKQEKVIKPHMDMDYSDNYSDYLIKANYRLSDYDRSVINTYFMDEGMREYDDYKGQTFKIRSIIKEWLTNFPKRKIDESIEVDDIQIQKHAWPKQCKDMEKYLFEMDLANIIGVKSIRRELIELYNVLSKRVAILYQQDPNLKISSSSNGYLAYANYKLLIQGYENIINMSYGDYKRSLEIDLSTLKFKESHEIDGIYYWDEDPEVKTTITQIENEEVKKLVKSFDNQKNI